MAPEAQPKKAKGDAFMLLCRLAPPVEVWIFAASVILGWLATTLPLWVEQAGQPVSCPGRNETLEQEVLFNMTDHQERLVAQIRAKAPLRVVERCVQMVTGEEWSGNREPFHRPFSQGYQDWATYHSFFSHMEYGEGFYIDIGANDPLNGSNTYFFDACLGWQGLCLEPNPMYAEGFKAHRTCIHIKNCIGPEEADLHLSAEKGSRGSVSENGNGIKVHCRPLQDVLVEHGVGMTHKGQRRVDFISLDIEGFEYPSLRCFPFNLFDIPLWLIETAHQKGYSIDNMMARAGYWMSPQLIVEWQDGWAEQPRNLGYHFDNLFVRWRQPLWIHALNSSAGGTAASIAATNTSIAATNTPTAEGKGALGVPALVLGPDFLPGGALEGEAVVAPCGRGVRSDCPEQVPAVEDELEYKDGKYVSGECKPFEGVKHRLSNPSAV